MLDVRVAARPADAPLGKERSFMPRTRAAAFAAIATVSLALTACGSSSLGTGSGSDTSSSTTSTSSAAVTADPALVAKLPESLKSKGTITIGTDATYAPNEFLASDGKTVQGMDVDLFDAVAAKFGLKTEWQPAGFDTIILGVKSGKYDVGVSSFTINADRKQQVNMVSYFNAGTQWVAKAGNPKNVDPNNACGLNIGVQKGTVQIDDIDARSQEVHRRGQEADQQDRRAGPVQGHRRCRLRQGRRDARRLPRRPLRRPADRGPARSGG